MDVKDLIPVEWNNQRVLLTNQLAKYYGCSTRQIKQNFSNNADHFVEGKHFFKLEGAPLKYFKNNWVDNFDLVDENDENKVDNFDLVGKNAKVLYLWTERGAARHAKMLSTDKAWEVFELLEDTYFNQNASAIKTEPAPVADKPVHVPNPNRVAGQHKNACLYVSAVSNGTVKFGQSCNVKARKANIQSVHKVKLGEPHTTSDFPRKVACLAEQACKDIFAPYRVEGEFFRVDKDLACRVVDALDKLITALPSALELEFVNKVLELVKIVSDTPEGKALLIKAENILVDKKLV